MLQVVGDPVDGAVRLDNPTDDTLEPGPVTVYGDGRFIGTHMGGPVANFGGSPVMRFFRGALMWMQRNGGGKPP